MENNIIVGLDIGTTKIAVLVGRRNEYGKIEIIGRGKAESLGVRKGQVLNIDQTVTAIVTAVEQASAEANVDIKVVNVGIAGQHIRSMQHRGIRIRKNVEEEITREDVNELIEDMFKLVMQPGEEIIHVLPQEFIVDNEPGIKDPVGMAGVRLEANFHIITGQVGPINNLVRCVRKAGLQVQELVLEPLASAEAVLSDDEKEAGVALIDIGGGTTDIAIFHEGIIRHSAVIPFGGNVVTDDIKTAFNIIRTQAELLKVKFGSAVSDENRDNEIVSIPGLRGREPKEVSLRNLASIIEARMEEILHHVMYEIKNSGYEKRLGAGIVITGGGSQLRHIIQLTEFQSGEVVKLGYPTEHLAAGSDEIKSPMYATGVGLVIVGMKQWDRKHPRQVQERREASATNITQVPEPEPEQEPEQKEENAATFSNTDAKENLGFWDRFKKWFTDDIK
jgi:cell division protein FtsA